MPFLDQPPGVIFRCEDNTIYNLVTQRSVTPKPRVYRLIDLLRRRAPGYVPYETIERYLDTHPVPQNTSSRRDVVSLARDVFEALDYPDQAILYDPDLGYRLCVQLYQPERKTVIPPLQYLRLQTLMRTHPNRDLAEIIQTLFSGDKEKKTA